MGTYKWVVTDDTGASGFIQGPSIASGSNTNYNECALAIAHARAHAVIESHGYTPVREQFAGLGTQPFRAAFMNATTIWDFAYEEIITVETWSWPSGRQMPYGTLYAVITYLP